MVVFKLNASSDPLHLKDHDAERRATKFRNQVFRLDDARVELALLLGSLG